MKKIFPILLAVIIFSSCSVFKSVDYKLAQSKTNFDISKLDKNGLIKNRGVSLAYEFCIPNNESALADIKRIDETISIYISSVGRIGCSKTEVLCIGQTYNTDYKKTLIAISKLSYVEKINESLFE